MRVTPEIVFSFRFFPLFASLSNAEIMAIASVAGRRIYKPGSLVCEKGESLLNLQLVVEGKLESIDEESMISTPLTENFLGVKELLFDVPAERKIIASVSHGAECFLIRKSNFFTILHECPTLLLSYFSGSGMMSNRNSPGARG